MPPAKQPPKSSVKETLTQIAIAFAMAFVFRGFVIEAFLIPTGSMAPTLNGAHIRAQSPQTGYRWNINPRDSVDNRGADPLSIQGGGTPLEMHDPMTNEVIRQRDVPLSWGDRIFVMKYLYSIYDHARFDVIVFKSPLDPTVNLIKRLTGLPGDMIAIIDGDIFARHASPGDDKVANTWTLPGWVCQRKPERAQRAMWQLVFDSRYAPLNPARDGSPWFHTPWLGVDQDPNAWQIDGRQNYRYSGKGPTTLAWDSHRHPVRDYYAYDEFALGQPNARYPVSDLRLSTGFRPESAGATVSAIVETRGHEFRADVSGNKVTLRMRQTPQPGQPDTPWTTLGEGELPSPLSPDKVTNLDFWHVDQSLSLYSDGKLIAHAEYNWSPAERIQYTFGLSMSQVAADPKCFIAGVGTYPNPKARFEFSGGPFTLYRTALSRDIHYQANTYHGDGVHTHVYEGLPARGTHPASPCNLSPDQFFVCGDNSPLSYDARLWDKPSPYVAPLDPDVGVVNRDLLIGKAFFVYFPAPSHRFGIPIPDFGDMRFIW